MLGTLADLQTRVGGRLVGDGSVAIARVSAVDDAGADALTFATDEKYYAAALASAAAAVLVDASVPVDEGAANKPLLIVENARAALATFLAALKPPRPRGPFRHPTATVEEGAQIGADVYLGAHSFVGARAQIGRGSTIAPGAYVGDDVQIGEDTWLHPRAVVHEHCVVGSRVVLHSGSVIGSEGFGWAFLEGRLERIPQIGNVVLEDEVEIGANSCVDRAQTGSTQIGYGTKIDNLVQIGHNCRIGKYLRDRGADRVRRFDQRSATSSRSRDRSARAVTCTSARARRWPDNPAYGATWPEGAMISGNPARDHRETLRNEVMLRKLPQLLKRIDALEKRDE
jgi:UDP-3-O-[3-hydroxymyristoyl] glucosamine N-acyltransferase